jgi:hypothetical protein
MEIQVSLKSLTKVLFILLLAAALFGAAFLLAREFGLLPGSAIASTETPSAYSPDAQAAVNGVKAFYTLDYTVLAEQWEAAVCKTMTPDGCRVFQALYAPVVRLVVEQNQVQTGCSVQALRLVEENGDGSRTWLLEVMLDAPWPGVGPVMPIYAEVVPAGDNAWLLDHILLEEESSRFQTPAPQEVP